MEVVSDSGGSEPATVELSFVRLCTDNVSVLEVLSLGVDEWLFLVRFAGEGVSSGYSSSGLGSVSSMSGCSTSCGATAASSVTI